MGNPVVCSVVTVPDIPPEWTKKSASQITDRAAFPELEPYPPTTPSASQACDENVSDHIGAGRSGELSENRATALVGTTNGGDAPSGKLVERLAPRNVATMTGDSPNACLYAL